MSFRRILDEFLTRRHERTRLYIREWWREEAGSDALMDLRVKIRLWLDRAREPQP